MKVAWRQNDDIAPELYEDLHEQKPTYSDELVRVYETRGHYIIVDKTNPCGGHLLYVEKSVPLLFAVAAAEKVIYDELMLNIGDEEKKERILDELAIKNEPKELVETGPGYDNLSPPQKPVPALSRWKTKGGWSR